MLTLQDVCFRKSTLEETQRVNLFEVKPNDNTYSFFFEDELVGVSNFFSLETENISLVNMGLLQTFKKGYGKKIVQAIFNYFPHIDTMTGYYLVETAGFWDAIGATQEDGSKIDAKDVFLGDIFKLKREALFSH